MNYILQLSGFFHKVAFDNRLNPTHVSLYMAIFQFWNAGHFKNPVSVSRQELMRISKISAKATYHKCIKDLHSFGYIRYLPSFNPYKGSLVYLFDFQTSTEQVQNMNQTKIETSIEQALVPYINNINNTNNIEKEEENQTRSKNDIVLKVSKKRVKVIEVNDEKVSEKEEGSKRTSGAHFTPPVTDLVGNYFLDQKSSEIEAEKFFNYYQSNGWKVGGKTPMLDWKAAANKWILNAPNFKQTQKKTTPGNLSTSISKNYSEPL